MLTLIAALALSASTESPQPLALGMPAPAPDPLASIPAGALAPSAPALLAADDDPTFSYTFVEIGTNFYDPDFDSSVDDDDVDSYYGKASLNLFKFFYLFAGYENQNFEFEDTDADLIRLGVGGHVSVTPKLDLQADIAWLYADIASDLDELDDTNGYEVRGGARWMPFAWSGGGVELNGGLTYQGIDYEITDDDGLFGWDAGVRVHFLRLLSVGASYGMLEDTDVVMLNGRVSF